MDFASGLHIAKNHIVVSYFCENQTYKDVNTIFSLKFDSAKSYEWMRICVITLVLSQAVMSFLKIFMVWVLPQTYLGLAIILFSAGFIIATVTCEAVVSSTLGSAAVAGCRYVNILIGSLVLVYLFHCILSLYSFV